MILFDENDHKCLEDPTTIVEESTHEELYSAAFFDDSDLKEPAAIAEFEDTIKRLSSPKDSTDSNLLGATERFRVQNIAINILNDNIPVVQSLLAKLASDKGNIIPAMKLLEKLVNMSPGGKLAWEQQPDKNGKTLLRLHLTYDFQHGHPKTGFHVMIPSVGTPTGKLTTGDQTISLDPEHALELIWRHIRSSRNVR